MSAFAMTFDYNLESILNSFLNSIEGSFTKAEKGLVSESFDFKEGGVFIGL